MSTGVSIATEPRNTCAVSAAAGLLEIAPANSSAAASLEKNFIVISD
jgi:hypothetical protein